MGADPDVQVGELRDLLLQLANQLRVHSGLDLTPSQTSVLVLLHDCGTLRLGEIARRLGVAKSSVTRIVAKLESAGYLTRQEDPADRRSAFVRLTRQGTAALREATARQDAWLAAQLGRAPVAGQSSTAALIAVLRQLLDEEQP